MRSTTRATGASITGGGAHDIARRRSLIGGELNDAISQTEAREVAGHARGQVSFVDVNHHRKAQIPLPAAMEGEGAEKLAQYYNNARQPSSTSRMLGDPLGGGEKAYALTQVSPPAGPRAEGWGRSLGPAAGALLPRGPRPRGPRPLPLAPAQRKTGPAAALERGAGGGSFKAAGGVSFKAAGAGTSLSPSIKLPPDARAPPPPPGAGPLPPPPPPEADGASLSPAPRDLPGEAAAPLEREERDFDSASGLSGGAGPSNSATPGVPGVGAGAGPSWEPRAVRPGLEPAEDDEFRSEIQAAMPPPPPPPM